MAETSLTGVTRSNDPGNAAAPAITQDMVWIPRGTFRMGSDRNYPEEAPAHRVTVDGFWIEHRPVLALIRRTNGPFSTRNPLLSASESATLTRAG